MDRRSLILSGAVLGAGALSKAALAQTQLAPARPADQGSPYQRYQQNPAAAQPVGPSYPAEDDGGPAPQYAQQPAYPAQDQSRSQNGYPQDRYPDQQPYSGPQAQPLGPPPGAQPQYAARPRAETYSQDELVNSVSDFLGVTAESAGAVVERVFRDNGRPTGYIAGEELAVAFVGGVRYGKGLLYMKNRRPEQVFWQGPSVGFDAGGNGSRSFTLCYNLQYPDAIYRRFPGVEGAAYFIGGLGVNYQRAEDITLAPIRVGVGFRLGANIGYLAYSRRRNYIPF